MTIFFIYLILVAAMNIITFFTYYADKRRAIRGEWRIRESVLILFSFFGGAFGGLLSMNIFRHKIRRWYFWVYNIVFFLLHIVVGIVIFYFCVLSYSDAMPNM